VQPIYHTFLTIPIFSLLNGIILILGFYYLGGYLQKIFKIEKIVEEVSIKSYQNISISVSFILILIYPICLFIPKSDLILKFVAVSIYLFSLYKLFKNLKFLNLPHIDLKKIFLNFDYLIFIILFLGLALLSFAPVTNADSLDYHLFTAKYLLENGNFPTYLTNFHSSRLSGAGEVMIALGLALGSEQFGSILQFSGLISLLGILKKKKVPYIFYIILFSSPVLIFFVSSIKPQLFSICSNAFVFSLIFFENFNKKNKSENYFTKKIILILGLLFLSTQIKFSFYLSAFLLTIFFILENLDFKRIIQIIKIALILYIIIILPSIIWKHLMFNGNFLELFFSPFSTELYGLNNFKTYLTALSEKGNYWFFVPTSLSNFTHSLGLGSLMFLYLIKLNIGYQKYLIISLITLFISISYFFGQFTSRFFYEPYLWIIVYLIKYNNFLKLNVIFKTLLRSQALIFTLITFYGVITLSPGFINSQLRDKILEKKASGYSFFKWVNYNLENYNEPIIAFDRSISFSKNFPISGDHLYYVNLNKKEAKKYVEEIKRINPKFVVFSDRNTTHKKYIGCMTKLFKHGKDKDLVAVRNPIGRTKSKFDAYIYEIDTNLMPKCINPEKVDPYAR